MRKIKLLISLMPLVLWGCNSTTPNVADAGVEVPVTVVNTMNIETDLNFVADINAIQNVEIRARVNGYLEKIYVDEGRSVEKGQLLFKINDEEYKAELHRADANLKSAEAEYKSAQVERERVKMLVEKEVIAKTEMDLAIAKIDIALAKIEQAKADAIAARVKLEHTSIRAPFSGVIDRIPYKLGSLISQGTLLTTVSDASFINAYFNISEVEYLRYLETHPDLADSINGQEVELILADGSIYEAKGKIETMESQFDEATGTIAIRARFENKQGLLKHGSNGKIKVRRKLNKVMVIPQKATMEIQDRNFVFLVNEQNMVVMQSFIILQRYKDFYIVKSGLEPGQKIVYEGVQNIREGSVIKPRSTNVKEIYNLTNQ